MFGELYLVVCFLGYREPLCCVVERSRSPVRL